MSRDRDIQHLLVHVGIAIAGVTVVTAFICIGFLGTTPYVEITVLASIAIACVPLLCAGLIEIRQGIRQLKRATCRFRKRGVTLRTTVDVLLGLGAVVLPSAVVVMLASGMVTCVRVIVVVISGERM